MRKSLRTFFFWVLSGAIDLIVLFLFPLKYYRSSLIAKRLSFEERNKDDPCSRPFEVSDFLFEFSSVGEFEQARPILDELLARGKKCELLFFSPSVELRVQQLAKKKSEQIRILRFPLLTRFFGMRRFSLERWSKAKNVIVVRYDFFPSLLLYVSRRAAKKVLILASRTTSAWEKASWKGVWLRSIYRSFDSLVCPTHRDEAFFENKKVAIKENIFVFDFRVARILRRQQQATSVVKTVWQSEKSIKAFEQWARGSLIFGNCYVRDLELLGTTAMIEHLKNGGTPVVLVPHKTDPSARKEFKTNFERFCDRHQLSGMFFDVEADLLGREHFSNTEKRWDLLVLWGQGFLCELYTFGDLAFVSGPVDDEVHSLLEPILGGCLTLCRYGVEHSTEKDLIEEQAPEHLKFLTSSGDLGLKFADLLRLRKGIDRQAPTKVFEQKAQRAMEFVIGGPC